MPCGPGTARTMRESCHPRATTPRMRTGGCHPGGPPHRMPDAALVRTQQRSLPRPRHTREPSPLWVRYLLAGSAVALAYLLVPATVPMPALGSKVLLYGGVSASAVAALVVGVRTPRPDNPAPWYALIAGQAIYLLADLAFYVQQYLVHSDAYPAPADALYLAHYPFVILGVLLLA